MSERSIAQTAKAPVPVLPQAPAGLLQRQCACGQHTTGGDCEQCRKKKGMLQRRAAGPSSLQVAPPIVSEVLRSPGRPLPPRARAFFEPRFGHDFSQVRLHTDHHAAESARAVNALAYTVGPNVVFAANRFAPDSLEGQRLMAHELAHVVQQSTRSQKPEAVAIDSPASAAEREAEFAEGSISAQNRPSISSTGIRLAAKQLNNVPEKIPTPGSFLVKKLGSTFSYTFNSQDILSWSDPARKLFAYYAKDSFGVDESVVQRFVDYLADEQQQKPGGITKAKLAFYDLDPVAAAKRYPAVTIPILLELHEQFGQWVKDNKLGEPRPVQAGYRELEPGGADLGSEKAGGGGKKTGPGGRKGEGQKAGGGGAIDRPPDFIVKMGQYYKYLLRKFPSHRIFSKFTAAADDFVTFAGNRPESYNALPPLPADLSAAPSEPAPFELFLDQWAAFMEVLKESSQSESKEGKGGKKQRADEGAKEGSADGVHKFNASAKLEIAGPVQPKYVKGSKIGFRAVFDRSTDDNYFMNFPPFQNHAIFVWAVYRQIKGGSAPEKYDTGPVFEQGAREYDLSFDKLGTYSVQTDISSPYFTNQMVHLTVDNILVVNEAARAHEVFDAMLADPNNPESPFERDEQGQLKLKPGQTPFSIAFEIGLVESEKKRVPDLVKNGKVTQEQATEYLKYLDERMQALNAIKGEEQGNKDYKRYVAEGTYLSRENSQSVRLQNIMYRKGRRKSAIHMIYEVELVDTTLDPSHPALHPGDSDIHYYSSKEEAAEWVKAEKQSISAMAEHLRGHNDYPDGTVTLGVQRLEDGQLMQLPAIDTHNAGKTVRAGLGYVGLAAGVVALAATPFTGGASAPVGIVILQASAIAIGVASVLLELNERYQKEGKIKADKRLLMDIATLVAAVMGAGGFSNALRTASQAGKLLYVAGMVGLDVGSGVILTLSTRDEINRIEGLYGIKIADEKDPDKKKELEKERDEAISRVIGAAALNGAFVVASAATGAHQLVGGVGRKTGTRYTVRQEVLDLAASANTDPAALRARLEDPKLTLEERSFLQESASVPRNEVPVTKGEVTEKKIGKLGGINDETRERFRDPKNEPLLDALNENSLAAEALKLCHTPCIPEFATPSQVRRLNKLLQDFKKAGFKVDQAKLKEYMHGQPDVVSLGEAIDTLGETFTDLRTGRTKAAEEWWTEDAKKLEEELGIRERKPVEHRLAEAKEGQDYDIEQGKKYPANQVPIRDKTGKLRRLDSYDAVKGEIVSRKSLSANNGQIANTDEATMLDYFQEFALKYPHGATIADVPSTRKSVGGNPPLAGQTVTGQYILEVPPQKTPIPERILAEAKARKITIRDENGKVY